MPNMRLFTVSGSHQENARNRSSFLLTNKIGGYVSLSTIPVSRYQGCFFSLGPNNEVYKIIEDFVLTEKAEAVSLTKRFWAIERNRKGLTEKFFMPCNYNSVVYELSTAKEFDIILDCRKSYDTSRFGNYYSVLCDKDLASTDMSRLVIKFEKKRDPRNLSMPELTAEKLIGESFYTIYIALVSPKMRAIPTGNWVQRSYEYDKQRGSEPSDWYVYSALRIKTDVLVVSAAETPEKALAEANSVLTRIDALKAMQSSHVQKIIHSNHKNTKDHDISAAYASAMNSVDQLFGKSGKLRGVYAGLWWFFQFWPRDEAVSIKALLLQKRVEEAKQICFRLLSDIDYSTGLLHTQSNNPDTIFSIDAVGWLFHRLYEMHKAGQLNKDEAKLVRKNLRQCIESLTKNRLTADGLVFNAAKETWMDSIQREGCRIEIQAMLLRMHSLIKNLCNNPENPSDMREYYFYDNRLKNLHSTVLKKFWNNEILADGITKYTANKTAETTDWTIRPNVFIAYYIYPDLLSREEWARCFENSLKHLWLDWDNGNASGIAGGISTVDKKSSLFHAHSTGEHSASYHNGDSWYWLNNLAAICMHRLDSARFKTYISAILRASTNEILHSGILGSHAELSSAAEQTSEGCLSQAWSNAMYIELIDEIF